MYCQECADFFQPPPEEEKLITTGGLPVLCPACEQKRWRAKNAQGGYTPLYPGMAPAPSTGRELYRAARFDHNGVEVLFVALPQKPVKVKASPLRKDKLNRAGTHVFVMSENISQLRTDPRVQLITNLETYEQFNNPLEISKLPSCWDPFTGTGEIVIPKNEIMKVEKTAQLVRVDLKDGGWVHLHYR